MLVFGLVGVAVGAHQLGRRIQTWRDVSMLTLVLSVFAAFLAFVVGWWVAAKIGGFRRAETATLHGAIAWLVAVPGLALFAALGSAGYFGTWYGALAGTPAWAVVEPRLVQDAAAAAAARNGALSALTAILLGLVGAVIGGWMASGEPMTLTYRRAAFVADRPVRGER